MKTIALLKILINIFFGFFLLLLAYNIWEGLIFMIQSPEEMSNFWMLEAYGQTESSVRLVQLHLLFETIPYIPFALGILFARNIVAAFVRKEFFSVTVTRNFRNAGILFLVASVLMIVQHMIGMAILGRPTVNLIIGHHFSYAFLIIIGLLFIFFGHVFSRARELEQENELTI
ncbi:DUF2975 domain-containing protein [Sungkyunkwania multivorans]|uniref:DUF2975 domain-containing protein n=1 Tax=Sungkyunkwania multivorans TaxID=1173618 RepID=A0ABW3D0E9_9FLAO